MSKFFLPDRVIYILCCVFFGKIFIEISKVKVEVSYQNSYQTTKFDSNLSWQSFYLRPQKCIFHLKLTFCVFKKILGTKYNYYQSTLITGWYLAQAKQGEAKSGPKTKPGQRAVDFIAEWLMDRIPRRFICNLHFRDKILFVSLTWDWTTSDEGQTIQVQN